MLKQKLPVLLIVLLLPILLLVHFCTPSVTNPDEVRVRFPQDPGSLNPVNYNNIYALQVIQLLFQSLLVVDLADGNTKPLLAQTLPQMQQQDSVTLFTFQLREEALWENKTPVVAEDVAFSLKLIKCPLVNNERVRLTYEFIRDIKLDSIDNRKFTIVCDPYFTNMENHVGDFFIMPTYMFDPKGLLKPFSLSELTENFDSLSRHPSIQAFAEHFNTEKFSHDKDFLKGSGGYLLSKWRAGAQIELSKKENWWALALPESPGYITAHPSKINFQVIPDNTTALTAIKSGAIDVYESVPAAQFTQLQQEAEMTEKFAFFTPETYDFVYMGINSRLEKFANRRTRQALAHLIDLDNIIEVTQENFATKINGPVSPIDSVNYNSAIKPYPYDLAVAEKLLKEAGWQQENGEWYKIIEEEKIPLTIAIQYRAGNTEHENIALIFKQSASRINIPVEIQPSESVTLSNNLKTHRFEMFIRGIAGSPNYYNFKPLLHSQSAIIGGGNFTGFGTAESDSLIDVVNSTADAKERATMLKRLQEIIHTEASIVFLYNTQNRIIVNKRFTNLKISGIKPGSDVSAFQLETN